MACSVEKRIVIEWSFATDSCMSIWCQEISDLIHTAFVGQLSLIAVVLVGEIGYESQAGYGGTFNDTWYFI